LLYEQQKVAWASHHRKDICSDSECGVSNIHPIALSKHVGSEQVQDCTIERAVTEAAATHDGKQIRIDREIVNGGS